MPKYAHRPVTAVIGAVTVAASLALALPADAAPTRPAKPTIVLVHGAFADPSSWNGVIERLRRDGYPVRAAATPLRGIASDAASVKSLVDFIGGPVVLVGHSYGGAVISTAAAGDPAVKSLVYIAAFAPDTGETVGALSAKPVQDPIAQLPLQQVPTSPGNADLYIDPAKFRGVFAADVDKSTAADMAATQEPLNAAAFSEPATVAAWRTIPSWYLVARQDKAIAPDLERFMAARAKSRTVEINSSHVAMVSHPEQVTRLIEAAAR
ncbi:alpha/beta fold hydrolase [Actinoplanes sp. M2I2]|uniref:alpha/beta fold hydrolase n=1 Tax=Actinoplanes sp. M2I2 TaxID=1734444 RepID=UPI002021403F|nr:alpha/beta hydrolase [Actinoplanes sp. M2I2]